MNRYSVISEGGFPREFLLLQGTGCRWRQCSFCDYHSDAGPDPFSVNKPVLEQVTGEYGTLDIINSGSAAELDDRTLDEIRRVAEARDIFRNFSGIFCRNGKSSYICGVLLI